MTARGTDKIPLEMGATWFGPQHQNLIKLLEELEIPGFKQYAEGSVLFEASPSSPPQAIEIPPQAPSFRITGGTSRLIQKLAEFLSDEEIFYNEAVKELIFEDKSVKVITTNRMLEAEKVICCIPPALLVNTIELRPGLPQNYFNIARNTHTWMQESIKAGVVYKEPFWKGRNISAIFSNSGPVVEFHDHSDATDSRFALCGFLHPGVEDHSRSEREEKVVRQLVRLFGEKARDYLGYEEVVWKNESFTSVNTGQDFQPHQNNGNPVFQDILYDGRMILCNSETSPVYGGYMEGAVYAANVNAKRVLEDLQN